MTMPMTMTLDVATEKRGIWKDSSESMSDNVSVKVRPVPQGYGVVRGKIFYDTGKHWDGLLGGTPETDHNKHPRSTGYVV